MKKGLATYFLMFALLVVFSTGAAAQHFIAIQSADNTGFMVTLNGAKASSAKSGSVRISNLSAGTYKLVVSFAGDKYPAQNFNCTVAKDDEIYVLKNMGQTGWVLKNIKGGQAIAATNSLWDDEPEGKRPPGFNAFGEMLAEVANDSDLLKPTVWVYTNKLDGADAGDTMQETQKEQDTSTLNVATRGVIKVSETDTTGGKKLVFYDFNASGGDTIHLVIPTTDVAGSPMHDTTGLALNKISNDTAATAIKTGTQDVAANGGGDDLLLGRGHKEKIDTAIALDTSANRPFKNPFYKSDTAAGVNANSMHFTDTSVLNNATADSVTGVANKPVVPVYTTSQQNMQNSTTADSVTGAANKPLVPVDTASQQKPLAATQPADSVGQKTTAAATDTSGKQPAVGLNNQAAPDTAAARTSMPTNVSSADTSQHNPVVAFQTVTGSNTQKNAGDTTAAVAFTRADCKKMLTESALDKLKHKIYLETDENRMIDIAKKYLDGKCISTEQVKTLAGYFITDDARLNFFRAVYPFTYDYGNFSSLETFMIDNSYKEQFQALLK